MRDGDKKSDEETNTPMKNAWRSWGLGAALIIGLTVVAYLPAMRGGFVFDDYDFITSNRIIKAHNGLYRFWFTTEAPDYYPVTWSLWWLEWRFWGDNATGYHVVNVLLHAANALLIWIVLRRLKIPGAWLAGLVFAVHPVNVATVAWISEQKNTLSMLFYLVAILLYLRFDEESRSPHTGVQGWRWPRPRSRGKYGLSLAAFVLALLSKSAVVMLPVVLLGCVWWTRGRVRWKDFLCSVPFFILSLALASVTIWFQHNRALEGLEARTGGLLLRLAVAGCVPWFYLYKAFLPLNLSMMYPQWEIDASRWVSYLPGVILIGCFGLFWWKRQTWGRPLFFGLGYFVVTLFPVLGFFDQGFYRFSLVADHWQYYSIVGAIALLVASGERIVRRLGEGRQPVEVLAPLGAGLASVAVLVVLGTVTWRRACVYETNERLWRDTLAKNPQCWAAHNNLGNALARLDRTPEAIEHYEQALRIKPDFAEAHNNLGTALARLDRTPEAIKHWEQALRIDPDFTGAHNNLALALWQMGRVQEAIGHWEQAVRVKPDYAEAHNNLGNALLVAGRVKEAIGHFEQSLKIKPDFAAAHYNLGVALWQVGRVPEAIGHWEQAVQVKPDYTEAQYNLGVALKQVGRVPEAIEHWEQAVRVKSDYAEAQRNLAWLLATVAPAEGGDPVRAVTLAQRACELTGSREPTYLDTLAIAYAAAGRFDEAVATAQSAIELARTAGQAQLVGEIESRLELYRSGRAYHQFGDVTSVRKP